MTPFHLLPRGPNSAAVHKQGAPNFTCEFTPQGMPRTMCLCAVDLSLSPIQHSRSTPARDPIPKRSVIWSSAVWRPTCALSSTPRLRCFPVLRLDVTPGLAWTEFSRLTVARHRAEPFAAHGAIGRFSLSKSHGILLEHVHVGADTEEELPSTS